MKFCRVKKACVGDGGEREQALDDVFGYYHVAKSELRQNFAKFAKIRDPTAAKVFENKFGQVVLPTSFWKKIFAERGKA